MTGSEQHDLVARARAAVRETQLAKERFRWETDRRALIEGGRARSRSARRVERRIEGEHRLALIRNGSAAAGA